MRIADTEIADEELAGLCRKWKIRRLALFGSALQGSLGPDSDIDLLVDFDADESWTLMDLVRAEEEFADLIGRRVDLVDRASLQRSANWIRRNAILESAEAIYVP